MGDTASMSAEERIDELFALPADAFTKARDELARTLRAAGDRDGAAQVKALRRPTLAAWALNQLARRDAEGLRRLRECGERLATEQQRVMSGQPNDLRAAQAERRMLTDELVRHVLTALEEAGAAADPHADAVRGALDAVALDAESGQAVLAGRLAAPPSPPAGFGALMAVAPAPTDDPAPAPPQDPAPPPPPDDRQQRLADSRARLLSARDHARSTREESDDATARARRAADEVARLERELSEARERRRAAQADAQAAANRADDAAQAVIGYEDEVRRAEEDIEAPR